MTSSQLTSFLTFLSLWHRTHPRPVTCATLLPLAEECGVDLGRAVALRARRSNLGRLFSSVGEVGGWRIVAGTRTSRGVMYWLESCHAVALERERVESG